MEKNFEFVYVNNNSNYPWNLENSPVVIKTRGAVTPGWKKVTGMPLLLPWSGKDMEKEDLQLHQIELIPYGCTTLRITEFPTLKIVE